MNGLKLSNVEKGISMKATLTRFLGTLAIGWGLTAAVWAQQPLPGPTPLPPPTQAGPPDQAPPPGITISPGGCTPAPIVSGGCLDSCLPQCGFGGTWVVGGGVYYMAPFYNNNRAFTTSSTTFAATGTATTTGLTNFNNKLQIAPLAFVGYSWDNGVGIRFRWFQFREDNSAGATLDGTTSVSDALGNVMTPGPAAKGTTVTASAHLYLSAYDLEATYTYACGKWLVIGAAGARYAQINQGYSANATDPAGVAIFNGGSNHNFNGFGPTVALEGHRQICDLGFGVYASARASILFGSGHLSNGFSVTALDDPTSVSNAGSQVSVIPVGELEMGGEWTTCWRRFRFFAQVGVVGQIWWGTGNASEPTINSSGSPSNLGFIGGVARAGITF